MEWKKLQKTFGALIVSFIFILSMPMANATGNNQEMEPNYADEETVFDQDEDVLSGDSSDCHPTGAQDGVELVQTVSRTWSSQTWPVSGRTVFDLCRTEQPNASGQWYMFVVIRPEVEIDTNFFRVLRTSDCFSCPGWNAGNYFRSFLDDNTFLHSSDPETPKSESNGEIQYQLNAPWASIGWTQSFPSGTTVGAQHFGDDHQRNFYSNYGSGAPGFGQGTITSYGFTSFQPNLFTDAEFEYNFEWRFYCDHWQGTCFEDQGSHLKKVTISSGSPLTVSPP